MRGRPTTRARRSCRGAGWALAVAALWGCAPDLAPESSAPEPSDVVGADAGVDAGEVAVAVFVDAGGGLPTQVTALGPPTALFDPVGMHAVALHVDAADWQEYLAGAALGDGQKIYAWHKATVEIDGQVTAGVGIKGFGNGSQISNPGKPNVKFKFDQFDPSLIGPEGEHAFRLKAAGQDATFLREALAGALLRSIGGSAPRLGWARLAVNGVDYGPYQLLESVDKRYFKHAFGNKDGNKYEAEGGCMGLNCPPSGCAKIKDSYEGDVPGAPEIVGLVSSVATATAAELPAVLAEHLYLDELLADYAVDALLSNLDGLASAGQNYSVYVDEITHRAHFIATGTDLTFGYFGDAAYPLEAPWGAPNVWCPNRSDAVYQRIWQHPTLRPLLLEKFRALQCGLFRSSTLIPIVQDFHAALKPHIYADPKGIRTVATLDAQHKAMLDYITKRQKLLLALLGPCP